ncbi:MAG TPA: hypothetical protein VHH34_02795 [Pseudonocardiaceae bacterium]|nr:hypothetical protein [Pseudonocardiaceae bacterium]
MATPTGLHPGPAGRVWITFDGAIKTTAALGDPETEQLVEMLDKAMSSR